MAGDKKPRFMSREPRPNVATAADFEEVFARQAVTRKHIPMDIPVERIEPNPFQIRKTFDGIDELAATMRMHGFTSRLWVREHPSQPNMFQLVFGERRLRAAKLARIMVIPCDVTQFSDAELREIGLTENLQREDLHPLEEAEGFRQFIEEFGYSVRMLAERIGKDKMYVQNRLSLLRVPDDVRAMLGQRPDAVRAALEISKLPTVEQRRPLVEGIASGRLNQEDVRTTVRDVGLSVDLRELPSQGASRRDEARGAPSTHVPTEVRISRLLARDYRSFKTVIAHWQVLGARDVQARAHVKQYVEQILQDAQQVLENLEEQSLD
ncbi:MAG: hypothetical protein NVSMB42_08310 [Herpetosiphon sp.]